LLATYVNLRLGDLLKIREKDIDLKHGVITILHPTKSKNKKKTVRLLATHLEIIKDLKNQFPAVPDMKFFRHIGGRGVQKNREFGHNILRNTGIKLAKIWGLSVLICMAVHAIPLLQRLQDVLEQTMQERQVHTKRTKHLTDTVNSKMTHHSKWHN
jgi:integrase